ncbi:MAG: O-methyltransferase [Pseudonocardiales bacterium]|nr:O-methyltransferase [Pseudonocardiales bacterium]MBV9032738.1 O-methyltransferase [Pseudonocardiales bacterium]MBW0010541.1 O-methyltransferase [Pseudonocardiales bacterium]
MSQQQWTAVDDYVTGVLVEPDEALDAALAASDAAGLLAIAVSPAQGKLLNLLARLVNARRILEFGTLGGYSTIWLARALPPDGRLITLEYLPKHAEVARANIARAGLADRVDVRVGEALDTLPRLAEDLAGGHADPFDLVFIDADKPHNADYFAGSVRLTRPGGVIIVDNVVRGGAMVDAHSADPDVQGARRLIEMMAADALVSATVIQTVGAKGYDGFAIAIVGE